MQTFRKPLVSILVPTFNHSLYIEKCLEGIAAQVCNFDIEVIICDDASADDTVERIKAFDAAHPLTIRPTFRTENVGMNANVLQGINRCSAPYIAICEGDDYWTDPGKLQAQVDFLETHQDHSICFHPVEILDAARGQKSLSNAETQQTTTIADLAKRNYIHTASAVLRNYELSFPNWLLETVAPDYGIFMLCAIRGPIKMLSSPMAVYRKHPAGIWSQLEDFEMREKIVSYLLLMKDQFDNASNKAMNERLETLLTSIIRAYVEKPGLQEKANYYTGLLTKLNPSHDLLKGPSEKPQKNTSAGSTLRFLNRFLRS